MSDIQVDVFGNRSNIFDEHLDATYFPIDTEREKRLIREQAQREKELREEQINRWIEENSPTEKGTGDPNSIWSVPVPSHFEHLKNNKVDYRAYGTLLLGSNYGGLAYNMDAERYLYRNKIDEVVKMGIISESTIKRHITRLKKVAIGDNKPLVTVENSKDGVVYKLNYATSVEDIYGDPTKERYYITIPSDILKFLLKNCKDGEIKTYVLLNVLLQNGSKEIQREYIASNIGIKDVNTISDYTTHLAMLGLITKEERLDRTYKNDIDKEVLNTHIKFTLTNPDDWRRYQADINKGKDVTK